jgi:hypothetical protein
MTSLQRVVGRLLARRLQERVERMPFGTIVVIRNSLGRVPWFHQPLNQPRWITAPRAWRMRAEDPVVGLELDGRAWALPWWIMKNHHVANLHLNGQPIVITLCEACSSAAAFDPVIRGRPHSFRAEAWFNGTLMAIDYETGSYWTGFTGECLHGPLNGTSLPRLPLVQATWREWSVTYPHTLVPDGRGEPRGGHGWGHAPGTPGLGHHRRLSLIHPLDERLPHNELVLGVRVGETHRCYRLATLTRLGPAVNDTLGGQPVVVFSKPGSFTAIAFDRTLDGRPLTFTGMGETIVDVETGSSWRLNGHAAAGPLAGRRLSFVDSGIEEFYIWTAFHPGSDIFGASAEASGSWPPVSTIQSDSGVQPDAPA